MVVTNILGAAIGGFGVPFSSLSEDEAVLFLKVRAKPHPHQIAVTTLKPPKDPLHRTILVHHIRRPRKTLRPLLLWPPLLRTALPPYHMGLHSHHPWLDHLLPLCDILPGLAHMVQLDDLYPNDELSGYVCLLKRYGYCAGYINSVLASWFREKAADQQEPEDGGHQYFWAGYLVRLPSSQKKTSRGTTVLKACSTAASSPP